jgi:threonine dehydratase
VTFKLCERVIDRSVLVSEPEILTAMRWAHGRGWPIEGAAGVAIAAYMKKADRHNNQRVVIIVCGGNTSPEVLGLL